VLETDIYVHSDAVDEVVVLRACFLLLDLYLIQRTASKAVHVLDKVHRIFREPFRRIHKATGTAAAAAATATATVTATAAGDARELAGDKKSDEKRAAATGATASAAAGTSARSAFASDSKSASVSVSASTSVPLAAGSSSVVAPIGSPAARLPA